MENQGKKKSQIEDSGAFAFIALIIISFILMLLAGLCSCNTSSYSVPQEERIWIHMSDGDSVELVADEYGSQYIKQRTYGILYIYIPYIGETEEGDTLHFFNAKNK